MILVGQIGISFVFICPGWRSEFDLVIGLADLKQTAHSHSLFVCHVGRYTLAKLRLCLSAVHIFGIRQRAEDGIARAVCKIFGAYHVKGLRIRLPRLYADDPVFIHRSIKARGVEQQSDIFLEYCLLIEYAVPYRIFERGVLIKVFKEDLLDDAALAVILAVRSAYPHSDLA